MGGSPDGDANEFQVGSVVQLHLIVVLPKFPILFLGGLYHHAIALGNLGLQVEVVSGG
jgi:hypothetical protein